MLTDTQIKTIKLTPPEAQTKRLIDSGGFILYTHTGRYWRWRFRFTGKHQIMCFGEYPKVSLLEARMRRDEAKKLLYKGIDPRVQKQNPKNTFDKIVTLWQENWKSNKNERHINRVIRRYQVNIQPKLGHKLINNITAKMVIDLVHDVNSRGAHDVAKRVLMQISQIFRYALIHEYIAHNPITIKPNDILPAHTVTNLARIDEREFGALLQKIEAYQGNTINRTVIQLMALTFVRTVELIEAKWVEFDLETARWNISAMRMKMNTPHIVPLSTQVISLL